MSDSIDQLPELKQILGALLFAAKEPLSLKAMKQAMVDTGSTLKGPYEQYAKVETDQLKEALRH